MACRFNPAYQHLAWSAVPPTATRAFSPTPGEVHELDEEAEFGTLPRPASLSLAPSSPSCPRRAHDNQSGTQAQFHPIIDGEFFYMFCFSG